MDVAFYDENFKAHIIKDIVISDKEALNKVTVDIKVPVKAVFINHGSHAYSKLRFDDRSLACFENDLYKIDDYLTRCVIWRQLWLSVQDVQYSSLSFFNFVVKQLPKETVE